MNNFKIEHEKVEYFFEDEFDAEQFIYNNLSDKFKDANSYSELCKKLIKAV